MKAEKEEIEKELEAESAKSGDLSARLQKVNAATADLQSQLEVNGIRICCILRFIIHFYSCRTFKNDSLKKKKHDNHSPSPRRRYILRKHIRITNIFHIINYCRKKVEQELQGFKKDMEDLDLRKETL